MNSDRPTADSATPALAEEQSGRPLALFEGVGVELEYMIVDAQTLAVRPVADAILRDADGTPCGSLEVGQMGWSNELVAHVIELKTKRPATSLPEVARHAQEDVREINRRLQATGACLLPTAMHPWMDPRTETHLWPHEYGEVYQAFNRVFGCQGHGWSNLQSMHLNFPFADDAEFARLHAAIRLVLPLLPALAASSPVMDGRLTGILDNRLAVYRTNCVRVPAITGRVIPEAVFSRADYERNILERIYADIAPHDPEGILQDEWLNARGAIARFGRQSIEIRLLDIQECPAADLAIAELILRVLRRLVAGEWSSLEFQQSFTEDELAPTLDQTIQHAGQAVVDQPQLLQAFGLPPGVRTVRAVWESLAERVLPAVEAASQPWLSALEVILDRGCLARRIQSALGASPSRARLHAVYRELAGHLESGSPWIPD